MINNDSARTADRIEAGKWLADRGFGKAPLVVDAVGTEHVLREFISGPSAEDLETMTAILAKCSPVVGEPGESRGLQAGARPRALTAG